MVLATTTTTPRRRIAPHHSLLFLYANTTGEVIDNSWRFFSRCLSFAKKNIKYHKKKNRHHQQ